MGLMDRLLGREPDDENRPRAAGTDDARAIERYRYLLRTAPPEQIERAHEEAFARLSPEQRRQVLAGLSAETPEAERSTADDPRSLARSATRVEMRKPGSLERTFAGGSGAAGVGLGGVIGGTLLASVAGAFIGSAVAQQMVDDPEADGEGGAEGGPDAGGDATAADDVRYGDESGGDFGGGDFGGGDFGGGL